MNLRLVPLTEELRIPLLEMLAEWRMDLEQNHTNHSPWAIFRNDEHDFEHYLQNLEIKEETTEGRVPDTTRFCLDLDRDCLVGAVNIRHYLNEGLLETGGHIGDGIRPSERRKGYGTAMLGLALEECRKLGISRVLVTCDRDNIGSRKAIERNGGVLENEVAEDGSMTRRYWIALTGEPMFKAYQPADYEPLRRFLLELSRGSRQHINWNWARLEWMMEHPQFDRAAAGTIGTWWDGAKIVGAAIYDMYFGEAFCGVLPGYGTLYERVLDYAFRNLKDDSGLAMAICDANAAERAAAAAAGCRPIEQDETVLSIGLNRELKYVLPDGFRLEDFDPAQEAERFQWLLWQGFDHGTDRAEFAAAEAIVPQCRPHLRQELSLAAVDAQGHDAACCCVWYDSGTDYAYIEPVCTVPKYRGMGLGKAVVYEALNRAGRLGAKKAYVISDQPFYRKLGFEQAAHFTFYRKEADEKSLR